MSLIDRQFLTRLMKLDLIINIKKMSTIINIRRLNIKQHNVSEYVRLFIYLSESKDTALIIKEVHIINDLSVNVLLEMNILKLENIVLDLSRNMLIINSYNSLKMSISTCIKLTKIDTIIVSKTRKVIASHIDMKISIQTRRKSLRQLSVDRDFIFEPAQHDSLSICTHIVDHTMSNILIRNDIDYLVILSRRIRLRKVVKYETQECYAVDANT